MGAWWSGTSAHKVIGAWWSGTGFRWQTLLVGVLLFPGPVNHIYYKCSHSSKELEERAQCIINLRFPLSLANLFQVFGCMLIKGIRAKNFFCIPWIVFSLSHSPVVKFTAFFLHLTTRQRNSGGDIAFPSLGLLSHFPSQLIGQVIDAVS